MVCPVSTTGQHGDIVSLWLRRPGHGNALDPSTVERLHEELSANEARPECVAAVIRAEGATFCAGADVRACVELMKTPDRLLSFFDAGRRFMERLTTSRLVSIAVVEGLAAAGGLELVAAADIVIATDKATFADRHATFGFLPAFGATALLPTRVGNGVATSLLLGKRELDASAALAVNLVHRMCPADQVDRAVGEEVERLRGIGAYAIAEMKRLINEMEPLRFQPEEEAVRRFNSSGGYEPSRFIARGEQGRDSER